MWWEGTQLSVHWGQYCIRKQLWNQLLREFPQIVLYLCETNGEHCWGVYMSYTEGRSCWIFFFFPSYISKLMRFFYLGNRWKLWKKSMCIFFPLLLFWVAKQGLLYLVLQTFGFLLVLKWCAKGCSGGVTWHLGSLEDGVFCLTSPKSKPHDQNCKV